MKLIKFHLKFQPKVQNKLSVSLDVETCWTGWSQVQEISSPGRNEEEETVKGVEKEQDRGGDKKDD